MKDGKRVVRVDRSFDRQRAPAIAPAPAPSEAQLKEIRDKKKRRQGILEMNEKRFEVKTTTCNHDDDDISKNLW